MLRAPFLRGTDPRRLGTSHMHALAIPGIPVMDTQEQSASATDRGQPLRMAEAKSANMETRRHRKT